MKKVFIFCLVFFFAFCACLFAGTITLKTGQEIEGDIVGSTANSVSIDFMGVELTYFKDEVAAINGAAVGEMKLPESIQVPAQMQSESIPMPAEIPGAAFGDDLGLVVDEAGAIASAFDSGDIIERGGDLSRSLQSAPPISTRAEPMRPAPFITRENGMKGNFGSPQAASLGAVAAIGIGVFVLIFIIAIVTYAYGALCLQFIAKKTNQGPVWMAWVPIANLFLLAKIAGLPYVWLLIFLAGLIPYLGVLIIMGFIGYIWWKIAEARGKPGWMGILCVLPLIGFVGLGILAFTE